MLTFFKCKLISTFGGTIFYKTCDKKILEMAVRKYDSNSEHEHDLDNQETVRRLIEYIEKKLVKDKKF